MKRVVKKTGFVRKNDIYALETDEAFLIKVAYEVEEQIPMFGIAEALRLIADGKKVLQLNVAFTSTVAGPFGMYTLPSSYTGATRFILADQ